MAADTIDEVLEHVLDAGAIERVQRHSRTKRLRLHGADGYDEVMAEADRLSPLGGDIVRHLADRYGAEARTVLAIAEPDPTLAEPLVPGLPYLRAEAVYAVRYEMARTVDDVLSRRTRARLLGRDDSAHAAAAAAALIGPLLGWDDAEQARQAADYVALVDRASGSSRTCPRPPSTRRWAPDGRRGRRAPGRAGPGRSHPADRAARPRHRLGGASTPPPSPSPTPCSTVCAPPAPPSRSTPAQRVEASRDWWPLAMTWALDDQVAAVAAAVVRPDDAGAGRRGAARSATRPASPSPPPPAAAACAAARSRCTAGSCSTCAGSPASGRSTATTSSSTCWPAPSATASSTSCGPSTASPSATGRSRSTLSTVGGWLACRGAGQLSNRYGKIEDIVVGLDVVLADGTEVHTGGHARQAVGPDLTQLFVGSEGTLGVITGARLRAWPVPAGRAPGRVRVRHLRRRRSRPAAASCSAAPPPPSCASTTPSRPTAATAPATAPCCSCSTRATPRSSTPPPPSPTPSAPRSAPSTSTSSWSRRGSATATTCPPSRR